MASVFKEEKLYRIQIIKPCQVIGILDNVFGGFYPFLDDIKEENWGIIPAGCEGWIFKKWGRTYFLPDENQNGIEQFTPTDQPFVLIPYHKIKDSYKKLS
ncbi:hypothetical protein [Bacillus sp. J33]|uniref:hypothetical protein n=1 Tax=Bacillus sp. J33 TaxID=935836 RepID=UPI0004BC5923|nr:hypothetical protein [Bacillus sp. J33]